MAKKAQISPMNLVGFVVGVVAIFIALRVGVFTDAVVADAIPTDLLSGNQTETLAQMEENQQSTYNIVGIIPMILGIVLILAVIIRMARG